MHAAPLRVAIISQDSELRAQLVEVMRAVGCFAEQHEPLVRDELRDVIELRVAMQRPGDRHDRFGGFADGPGHHDHNLK